MTESFDLARFIEAQDAGGAYDWALDELRRGRKRSHWMWFVFPQIAGLGASAMSRRYAISSLPEARAYLDHPVLAARLRTCAGAVLAVEERTAEQIFGGIDAIKLHSSATLFRLAAPDDAVFTAVLDRYFAGALDDATVRLV